MKRLLATLLLSVGLLTTLAFTNQSAHGQESFQLKYNQLVHNFYREPKPELVPPTLNELLASDIVRYGQIYLDNSHHLYAYTFGLLGKEESSLVPLYKEIFKSASVYGRRLMIEVFQISGNDDIRAFLTEAIQDPEYAAVKEYIGLALSAGIPLDYSPLNYPIFTQQDLDLHWVEFFVRGDTAALQQIVKVLDRPDILRDKFQAYFQSDADDEEKRAAVQLIKDVLDISVEEGTYEIAEKQDLGGVIAVKARNANFDSGKFQDIQALLELSDADLLQISAKGAAIWSLESNARLHRAVFDFCEQQIKMHNAQAQLVLREIAARGHYRLGNYDKARDHLLELITMNPNRYEVNSFLAEVYIAQGEIDAAKMQLDYITRRDENLATILKRRIQRAEAAALSKDTTTLVGEVSDLAGFISNLRERAKAIRSFRSYAAIETGSANVMEWDFDFVSPDKFSVEQVVLNRGQRVLNKWMTVEDQLYLFMGVWIRDKEKVSRYDRTSETLRLAKWLASLPENSKVKATRRKAADKEYVLLEYQPTNLKDFFTKELPKETKVAEAEIWIDYDTGFVSKGLIVVNTIADTGNPVEFTYEQEFFGINQDISIEVPERVVDVADLNRRTVDDNSQVQSDAKNDGDAE